MPAGMFSIDSILSGRPSCKEPLLLHRSGPAVLPAGLTESLYTDYSGLYSATCGPSPAGIQPVSGGTRIGYNGYYYGQLHVQASGGGAPCCVSVPGLSPQQCPCIPAGRNRQTGTPEQGNSLYSDQMMHPDTLSQHVCDPASNVNVNPKLVPQKTVPVHLAEATKVRVRHTSGSCWCDATGLFYLFTSLFIFHI